MSEPLNVLVDVSPLGLGFENPACRAGIFRVTERFAVHLTASRQCRVSFCAGRYPGSTRAYLRASPNLRDVPLRGAAYKRVIHAAYTVSEEQLQRRRTPPGVLHRTASRVIRRAERVTGLTASPVAASTWSRADVYHSTFYPLPGQTTGSRRPARFLTVYDLIQMRHPEFFEGNLEPLQSILQSLTPDDWAICISQSTKDDLCEYLGFDPARVFVAYLGADTDVFRPCVDAEARAAVRQRYGIPDGPYILSVCTLEPRKNLDHVVRCFAKLAHEPDMRGMTLVLVGSRGWGLAPLFEAIDADAVLKGRVIVTGRVADSDLSALYSGALTFVYPSLYEGFGLPVLEAMQCGVPVVTSNTSSMPEVVGDAGILVAPRDPDSLCHALLGLMRDSNRRTALSCAAIERARRFGWQRCVEETIAAYETARNAS